MLLYRVGGLTLHRHVGMHQQCLRERGGYRTDTWAMPGAVVTAPFATLDVNMNSPTLCFSNACLKPS